MSTAEPVVSPIRYAFGIGILAAILVTIVLGLRHANPPPPAAADAPAGSFSAARAMLHLQRIAQAPHSIGSEQNAQVRNYLLAQLSAMGLAPQVQSSFSVPHSSYADNVGVVHNVIARLPGRKGGKALMLSAHYDSVPGGDGAADDGASVAAILETVRALRSGSPLENDVIVLLTDGEEAGLLGAEAFVAEHPWAHEVGVALNFEYRGNSGPFLMFETSPGNTPLIEGFARARLPIGSSMLYEVYKLLPNDTDLTPFKRGGIPGMNFAAIENPTAYHARLDRPELLDQASLQHQGEIMLSLARHFGARPLDLAGGEDRIYFDIAGLGLVNYPASWAAPLAGLAALAFALVLAQAVRAGQARLGRIAAAIPFFLILVAVLAVASHFLWMGIAELHPGYRLMPDTYNSHWYLMFFVALASGAFVLLSGAVKNWFSHVEVGFAALACWLAALAVVVLHVPGVSFLLTWPMLAALLSLALVQSPRLRAASGAQRAALLFAGAIPALLLFAPLLRLLYIALSPRMVIAIIPVLGLLLGLLTPLLGMLRQRFLLPALPLLASLGFLGAGAATAGFDQQHPRPNNLSYVQAPQPIWISADYVLDDWTSRFFPPDASRRMLTEIEGKRARTYWIGPAPALNLPAPLIEVLADEVRDGRRALTLRIASQRQAPTMKLFVDGAEVLGSSVQGKAFTTQANKDWTLSAHGVGTTPLDIALTVPAGRPLAIRAVDISYSLPKTDMPPRPGAMMPQPLVQSDTTQVVARLELK